MLPFRLLAASLLVSLPLASIAAAQAPSLSHALPAAARPGQSVDITFFGANLSGPSGLWTSFPCQAELAPGIEKNGQEPSKAVYRLTIPAEVPPGVGAVRVATDKGVSNLLLLLVDDLPSSSDNGQNKSRETAQEVSLPAAIDGTCEAESFDFYKFNAAAGQRVSVEVYARRLGSPLDPVVRLLDAHGRELTYSDDEPGIGVDSRFACQVPADGTYFLEIRDIQYAGSGNHRYRLRVGNFPLVTVPFPLAVRQGESARVEWIGPAAEQVPPVELAAPDAPGELPLAAAFPGGQGSAMARLVVSQLPELVESEPNDERGQATPISLPAGINGRLQAPKDRDFYRLEARQGERYVFRGMARRLGSPSDLFLRVYNADGGLLAEAEDNGTEEGSLDFKVPAEGTYYLMVEDLVRAGGRGHAYRVAVEPYQPGFSLALETDKFDVPHAGVMAAKVTCARRDYNGPITLELAGAPEGCQLKGNVIPEGKNETLLQVVFPPQLPAGRLAVLRILGRAKIGESDYVAEASAAGALQKQFAGVPYLPGELPELVAIGVGPPFPDFFKLAADPAVVPFPQVVGAASLKVKAERLNKFDDAIALRVEGLPEGISAEAAPIAKGQGEQTIALKGPKSLPEGEHKFRLVGAATFQHQPKEAALEVVLRVVQPLQVAAAPAGPIVPGQKQKLKISLTRFGDAQVPVTIVLKNLPAGVSGPEKAEVPAGKNELELELSAAADAALGKAEEVVAIATTRLDEQDVSAQSPPFAIEVKPAE